MLFICGDPRQLDVPIAKSGARTDSKIEAIRRTRRIIPQPRHEMVQSDMAKQAQSVMKPVGTVDFSIQGAGMLAEIVWRKIYPATDAVGTYAGKDLGVVRGPCAQKN
jgi:hypothetical protein